MTIPEIWKIPPGAPKYCRATSSGFAIVVPPNQAGPKPRFRNRKVTGPSDRRAVAFLGRHSRSNDEPLEPNRSYPPHLASRARRASTRFPIHWGARRARERGPIIGTVSRPADRNVIGSHGGSYALYRALAVSSGALDPIRRPDLTNTHPAATIGPFPQWTRARANRLARSLGPSGRGEFRHGDRRGRRHPPEHRGHQGAARPARDPRRRSPAGRLKADGNVVHDNGSVSVVKIAIDPVWYLPGIAERFGTSETRLRRTLFEQTAGMFPELVTRPDLQVFLPPIGGITVYLFGDVGQAAEPAHARSPAACTTSATAPTCSAPTSAPAGPISSTASRNARKDAQAGGARPHRLQPQGRPRARRGHQVPGLQRAQAPGGRRPGRDLFRAHRMRRRRAGRALPAADAGRAALARRPAHRPLRLDERHEVRRADRRRASTSSSACRSRTSWCPTDAQVEIEAKKAAGYFTPSRRRPKDLTDDPSAARWRSI